MLAQRVHAMHTAPPWTPDAGGLAPKARRGQALVRQRRGTLDASAACAQALAPHAQHPPACPLLQARPGAGPVFAARRVVACGAHRARAPAAAALQQYAGSAPVTARSGKQAGGHWRRQGPQGLRQAFLEWAAASLQHACWAQGYSQQQREQGNAPQAAVRARALQWRRRLERCWHERTPDDEATYLQALPRRGSSRRQPLAPEA